MPALSDYQHLASGKVRELYRVDDRHLLFVATDRISAYDFILDSEIPDKGRVLTAVSSDVEDEGSLEVDEEVELEVVVVVVDDDGVDVDDE